MEQIIIINTIEEQEFTFNNFDELRGYLKGKILKSTNLEIHEEAIKILKALGFNHVMRCVPLGSEYPSDKRIIEISDRDFFVFIPEELDDCDYECDDFSTELIKDYYDLKEKLMASILPWPLTRDELRSMTLEHLNKLRIFAEEMLDRAESLDLDEEMLEGFFGKYGMEEARQLVDNYEIQLDNLKYIW